MIGNAAGGKGGAGAGALIGAGVGALTGAVVGNSVDESEARNRALIEARLQRRIAGAAPWTTSSAWFAGVPEDVIVNHVRYHGMARQLEPSDYVVLQQQQVSPAIVKTMQEYGHPQHETVVVQSPPPPPYYYYRDPYYDPYWGPRYYYRPAPPPRMGIGLSFHN